MGETDDEERWARQSRDGDHEAFANLVARHQRMVHSVTIRMTGSLTEGEDLAQEVFIQAFRRLDTFRGEAKFSSWLYQIAVHACLNWRRNGARRERAHADWGENERLLGQNPSAAPDADAGDESGQRVRDALQKLPARQRAAVVLTIYEEMSHAEAARALGCSEITVSWRLFAARAKLKKLLGPALPR
jgi:RNA polymerase sigma-70 factor (ECF subfamily)